MTTTTGDGAASFVLFHDSHGRIFHVHKHVSFAGHHAADDVVEAGARAVLEQTGRSRADVHCLVLKDLHWQPGKAYKVDVARRALVVSDRPRA